MHSRRPASHAQLIPWRGVVVVVPVFAAIMLACGALGSLGWWMTGTVVAVLLGMAAMLLVADNVALMMGALLLGATSGIMGATADLPLFGQAVRGLPVRDATLHPHATMFRFADGQVLRRYAWTIDIYGASGTHHWVNYTMAIAPIVGDGWTPDQPITAWAATASPTTPLPRGSWALPSRGGVRVSGLIGEDVRDAIARAERVFHLRSATDAVVLRWLDDPEAAVAAQWWLLATMWAVFVGVWVVLVVGVMLFGRRRV